MSFLNKGIKIGEGKKYDLTKVSEEGITAEELKEIEKKNKKLIDIYKALGANGESMEKLDLALAMDGITFADKNQDGKLSSKELDSYAAYIEAQINNKKEADEEETKITKKDIKAFIKSLVDAQKNDPKSSVKDVLAQDRADKYTQKLKENFKDEKISNEFEEKVNANLQKSLEQGMGDINSKELYVFDNKVRLKDAFKDENSVQAKINASASMLGDYEGTITLKGDSSFTRKAEDGAEDSATTNYPEAISVTLPKTNGKNKSMDLKLVDEQNGVYESPTKDRQFQLKADKDGNVSLEAYNTEELNPVLEANIKAEQERQAAIRAQREAEKQAKIERQKAAVQAKRNEVQERLQQAPVMSWIEKKYNTFEDLAKAACKSAGVKPTKIEVEERVKDLKKLNPKLKDGELIGKRVKARVSKKTAERVKNRNNLTSSMQTELNNAKAAFDNQLKSERGSHAFVKFCLENNHADMDGNPTPRVDLEGDTKKDLAKYEKQIKELKNCKTEKELAAKFKQIYGIDYDPKKVQTYKNYQNKQVKVETAKYAEETFGKEFQFLVKGGVEEAVRKKQYFRNETCKNYQNKLAQQFSATGDTKDGLKKLEAKIKADYKKDLSQMTNAEKMQAFSKYAKDIYAGLKANTKKELGGKTYEQFQKDMDSAYKAAYGTKNNIMARVEKYSNTINTQAAVAKGALTLTAAIATGGMATTVAGAAIGVGATTGAISAADKSFDGHGKLRAMTSDEVKQVFEEAGVAAAMVGAGGKFGQFLTKTGWNKYAQYAAGVGGDVSMGMIAEKATTGEITVGGTLFMATFSAAGRLVSLVPKGKAPAAETNVPKQPKAPQQPKTTLEKATTRKLSASAPEEVAPVGSTKVGTKKADQIKNDVEQILADPNATAEQLQSMQSRELSREVINPKDGQGNSLINRLDKKAQALPPEQRAAYEARVKADKAQAVEAIPERHNGMFEKDVATIRKHVADIDNPAELDAQAEKLGVNPQTGKSQSQTSASSPKSEPVKVEVADDVPVVEVVAEEPTVRVEVEKPAAEKPAVKMKDDEAMYKQLQSEGYETVSIKPNQKNGTVKATFQKGDQVVEVTTDSAGKVVSRAERPAVQKPASDAEVLVEVIDDAPVVEVVAEEPAVRVEVEEPATKKTAFGEVEQPQNWEFVGMGRAQGGKIMTRKYKNPSTGEIVETDLKGYPIKKPASDAEVLVEPVKVEVTDDVPVVEVVAEGPAPKAAGISSRPTAADKPLELNQMLQKVKLDSLNPQIENQTIKGNGAVIYHENGVRYQVHYEGGRPTAVRVQDGNTKTYFKYENGQPVQIDRQLFIEYFNDSLAARNYAIKLSQTTAGEWERSFSDMKAQLDAQGTPYKTSSVFSKNKYVEYYENGHKYKIYYEKGEPKIVEIDGNKHTYSKYGSLEPYRV